MSRAFEPDRRGANRDTAQEAPDEARAALEVGDLDVDRLAPGELGFATGRRRELQLVQRRDLARETVDRQQVGPVPGHLDLEHVLGEREHVAERCARLEAVPEHHDPAVVLAELELALGEDHPVRHLAAELPRLDLQPTRDLRAGQSDGDRRARAEVPGAADDRARLALPHVHRAELELVGVWVLAGLEHAADAEVAEVAALVGDADVRDAVDLAGRDREPVCELLQRHLDCDVVAQP